MVYLRVTHKLLPAILTGIYVTFSAASPVGAQGGDVAELLAQLREAPAGEAERLSAEIMERWSASGSAAMDLLLMRGRAAIEDEDYGVAIEHLTALTDHAPEFAEGWNLRATAFFYQERYGEAIHDIEQVLALNPAHFNALTGLGLILEQLGHEADALRAFRAAAAIHPHQDTVNAGIARLVAMVEGTAL